MDSEGGAPGLKDEMEMGVLLVLGFGCTNGPDKGAGRV